MTTHAPPDPTPDPQEFALAQSAWNATEREQPDPTVVALAFGVNVRVNIFKAFKAAFHSAVLVVKCYAFSQGHLDPMEAFGASEDAVSAVTSTLDALRQKLSPLQYVACVVLSKSPNGIARSEFDPALRDFLGFVGEVRLPWYLWLSAKLLNAARASLAETGASDAVLFDLADKKLVKIEDDRVVYQEQNWTWGLK